MQIRVETHSVETQCSNSTSFSKILGTIALSRAIRTDNGDEVSELKLSVRNAEMSKANRRIPLLFIFGIGSKSNIYYQLNFSGGNKYDYQLRNERKKRGSKRSHMGWFSGGKTGTSPDKKEHKFYYYASSEKDMIVMVTIMKNVGIWIPGFCD